MLAARTALDAHDFDTAAAITLELVNHTPDFSDRVTATGAGAESGAGEESGAGAEASESHTGHGQDSTTGSAGGAAATAAAAAWAARVADLAADVACDVTGTGSSTVLPPHTRRTLLTYAAYACRGADRLPELLDQLSAVDGACMPQGAVWIV